MNHSIKISKIIFSSMLFMLLAVAYCSVSSQAAEYKTKSLDFSHKDDCENGPWELHRDYSGNAFAYEWDTHYIDKKNGDSKYWCTLTKMIWSKSGKLTYKNVKVAKKLSNRLSSGDCVYETTTDKKGNLYVAYYQFDYDSDVSKSYITVQNKSGKIIADFDTRKILKQGDNNNEAIYEMYADGSKLYVITSKWSSESISLYVIDIKRKKLVKTMAIDDISEAQFHYGYLYGVSKENKLNKISLKTGIIVQSFSLPEEGEKDYNNNDKFLYDVSGKDIYVTNANGIYRLKTTDTSSQDFQLIISKDECTCFNNIYTFNSLRVVGGRLYILCLEGDDDEYPSDVFMFNK